MMTHLLKRITRPKILVRRNSWPAFQVCGYAGYGLAIMLATMMVTHRGLSLRVLAGIVGSVTISFFALAMATKILTGEEQLVYYHHEIAALAVAALVVRSMGQPVVAYLDVTVLGVGLFLACGRIGCLMVGCCHGRPFRWGVTYGSAHAAEGFPQQLVGVPLFPVQAVEAFWVLVTVLLGTVMVWRGGPPGEALAWYSVSYGFGRSVFECARGDAGRPYFGGLSAAQWTSITLVTLAVAAEISGSLPLHTWHIGATAILAGGSFVWAFSRKQGYAIGQRLLHPAHLQEFVEATRQVSAGAEAREAVQRSLLAYRKIPVARTTLGIRLSADRIRGPAGMMRCYSFSQEDGQMTLEVARRLADLVLKAEQLTSRHELIRGRRGVFHLVVAPGSSARGRGAERNPI